MNTLTPPKAQIPIGVDSEGRNVMVHPEWLRYLTQSLFTRAGGTLAPSNAELLVWARSSGSIYPSEDASTDEGIVIPGPQGPQGLQGVMGPVFLIEDDREDPYSAALSMKV